MIKYTEEFYSLKFKGESMKEAYLKAVKWYATNVLSKDELHNIQVEYEKSKMDLEKGEQFPTVTIHLYAALTEDELQAEHCQICKEFSSSFFINEQVDCNRCTMRGYCNRQKSRMAIKTAYYKECLKRRLEN